MANTFTYDGIERLYTLTGGVPRDVLKVAAVAYRFSDGGPVEAPLCEEAAREALLSEEEHEQQALA